MCSATATRAEISLQADRSFPTEIYLFGHDGVVIDVAAQALANLLKLLNDPRVKAAREDEDDALTADEEIVIDQILRMPGGREIPIVRSRDQVERDARWDALLDRIEAMDEPEKSEFIGYTKGLLDGMLMHKEPAA
jgi:hypothetical protein